MTGRQLLQYMHTEMQSAGMLDKPVRFVSGYGCDGKVPVSFYVSDDGQGWIDIEAPDPEHAHAAELIKT